MRRRKMPNGTKGTAGKKKDGREEKAQEKTRVVKQRLNR